MGLITLARGGVRACSCAFPASHRLLGHLCECSQLLAQHSKTNALPVPSSLRFPKGPWRCRGATFFEKTRPQFLVLKQFRIVNHSVWCTSVFGPILGRAFKNSAGALFLSFGSRVPLLRPRRKTQLSVVIGVRSATLFGQNGPGTRDGCTFPKSLFLAVF